MVLGTAIRIAQAVGKRTAQFEGLNRRYNPIAKFETFLPPRYRKPYRYATKVGDAILFGTGLYKIAEDIYNDGTDHGNAPIQSIRKYRQFQKTYSRRGRRMDRRRKCKCPPFRRSKTRGYNRSR